MDQNDDKFVNGAVNGVNNKTKKANLRLAIILGVFVLFGMMSTFFMIGDKL